MPPNRPCLLRRAGVVEVDRVFRPAFSVCGKSTKTVLSSRSYLSGVGAEQNLVDVQVGVQIELDARVVLEHLEADRVLAADRLLVRIDADVEVVEEQIVVRAIAAVLAAQDVGARRWVQRRGRRCGSLLLLAAGCRHRQNDGEGQRQDCGAPHVLIMHQSV